MNPATFVTDLTTLHTDRILHWKQHGITFTQEGLLQLVEENHAFNYQLWNTEDKARRDDMGFEYVYQAKREIDHFNQQRNNRMESIDGWLFHHLQPASANSCKVHSETPGMMIDRLSILALKHYHMAIQTKRGDASADHLSRCQDKLKTIELQKTQLQICLLELLQEVLQKTRTFKIYQQFKMYNDPTLNPELYARNL